MVYKKQSSWEDRCEGQSMDGGRRVIIMLGCNADQCDPRETLTDSSMPPG